MKNLKNENNKYTLNIKLIFSIFLIIVIMSLFYVAYIRISTYKSNFTEFNKQSTLEFNLNIAQNICLIISLIVVLISIYVDILNQNKNIQLYKTAYIDPITSLGNEIYFKKNASTYLQKQIKNKYIATIDINKFKAINNIYGYQFCNNLLKLIGENLDKILPPDNITCRISNDVFATIFSYKDNIKVLLNKIISSISNLQIDTKTININLSIGVYKVAPEDTDINVVLNKSYIARSKIKGLYKDSYYIFDELLESKFIEEQKIEANMEQAIKNNEFKIMYQPKFFVDTEKLAGAEALVRWYKDDKLIPPSKFIPLFEKNKFIIKLDLYVFEQVCKDMLSWKKKYAFIPNISINVSKEHFENENFIDEYVKITNKYSIPRNKIDLEITESSTINPNINIIEILNNIKKHGFIISIDDFGTGYSCLSMLQNMPIDIIKIDKIFIDKANLNSSKNIINYIVLIAKHLNVKTIAEGVETKKQADFIKMIDCDIIQGFYYCKDLSKQNFEILFNET